MSARRASRRLALNAEINVVSLIDVILLLLLIFMVTAPMLAGGIDLQLPEANVSMVESPSEIVISIDKDGRVYVGDVEWSMDRLRNGIAALVRGRESVTLRADTQLNHGTWLKVVGVLRGAGITGLNVAGVPESVGR
jgi:biopolymer transport protein ExbD/biopolymer transport protein TolR